MKKVSIRSVTNFLKANNLDPAKLHGIEKLYGASGRKIKIRRVDVAKIRALLSAGQVVVMRPTVRGQRTWEFVDGSAVQLASGSHGARPKIVVTHGSPLAITQRAARLGRVLAEIRVAARAPSQKKFAVSLGFAQTQYNRYEQGLNFPRGAQLAKIAKYVEDNEALHPFKERLIDCAKAV